MIVLLMMTAATTTMAPAHAATPVPSAGSARVLLNGAEHAIEAGRLEQANIMVARAIGAGAEGKPLARVLADLAFAKGHYDEALLRYQSLAAKAPDDAVLLERAAVSALELKDETRASPFLVRATLLPNASWRAWNARGVAADRKADWADADLSYEQAARLAPERVEPVSNRGWSLVLRGKWQEALPYLEQAAAMDPGSTRIADNLELAREALAADLPQRRKDESASSWAARLNDAGVAAAILGDRGRATAAFTQALEASGTWYARAANNLEAVKQP